MPSKSPQVILDDPVISILPQTSITPRQQSVGHSPGDGLGDEVYLPDIPVLKDPPISPALHSLKDRDALGREGSKIRVSITPATVDNSIRERRSMGSEEVPSISVFQGSSNFQISNTNINTIGGDATIIRFGDGQFTEIQRNLICDYIANLTILPDINNNVKKHALTQSIISLPRAKAVFDDYQNKKRTRPCFKGTREALLREMADWATTSSESRMYILSGLAGIGKSTVAYTIASRAAHLSLLGASFFFSRDETDRKSAELFFTTIAYQLCVYNEWFAGAIGDVLLTERGSAATTKDLQDQLQALILEPLQSIVKSHSRPILVVVDALDECDEEDVLPVLVGLSQLVRKLPSFKVILTTRPQPYLDRFLCSKDGHRIFHLQDIEHKVVDGDIRLYLNYSLSLEAVQERYPQRKWCASAEEIDSLVHAAGRLFIIASTAVRHIFDKSASNPAAQMQKLLRAFSRHLTPFKGLDQFYNVVLRNVVPANCDNDDIVSRYRSVVGAIIFVQRPLPVFTLAHLINIDVVEIREVLDHLQSVILLGSDNVPQIYHKSFPDYITDQARCKDPYLRIDTRVCHTQIATRCFEIMDRYLKRNILGLGDPARFISNEDGLKKDGITEEQLQEKIPQQLHYASVYWANHLEIANIEDTNLMNKLERFVDEHMLHWFEVLSLIGKLDLAHHAIGVVLNLLKSRSSDLHQLLSDALRFIGKFYEVIERSALHTYHSALPFTPSDSLLYHRYIKDTIHNFCSIKGGPEKWDALVANLSHGEPVDNIKFSFASPLFVSCSQGKLNIWDAAAGTPISTISGHAFAIANDFSTVASSESNTITLYDTNRSTTSRDTTFTTSSKIEKLALSSESSRVAAALSDGSVCLWNTRNTKLIDSFDEFESSESWRESGLEFSPTGTRLTYSSVNGIKLRDAISGRFIAHLRCGSSRKFGFLGSRIASVSRGYGLTLWNSESGELIAAVRNVGLHCLAIGSLLATAGYDKVTLWSENNNSLVQIEILEFDHLVSSMAFSLGSIVLAITTDFDIKLYDVKTRTFISTLPFHGIPTALALSPDGTRLTVGNYDGNVNLWDIGVTGSPPNGNANAVTALALSRDCSRLACGFRDGTVELWETSLKKGRIDPPTLRSKMEAVWFPIFRQFRHPQVVWALGFDPNGKLFASGSDVGTIKLWNGGDGAFYGSLKAPIGLQAIALSLRVLVAAGIDGVTLWSLDTLSPIQTFEKCNEAFKVSIADDGALIAVFLRHSYITVLDAVNCTTVATFNVPDNSNIHTMTFLPDNSQLVVQFDEGVFRSLNLINKHVIEGPTLEHLIQLPNTPLRHGVPIWHCQDKEQHYFAALFSQQNSPVPVSWIPRQIPVTVWTQGSSMIALGCRDGRIIFLRLPTS